jgi:hypothetical protein
MKRKLGLKKIMEWGDNMAINLLAMANKLHGNLHSKPSGSRTRTSYQNQPGNLKRGTHIPGTNLKEDEGIRTVARKGRKGDTKLRKVGGEVAHVNTTEANAIDMLGPMGEAWVQSIGSGTRNPKTGLPEYHLWHKHGAHTKIGKGIESVISAATSGGQDWRNVETIRGEVENKKKYGSNYAESGGKQFYTDQLDDLLGKNIAGLQSTALEPGGQFGELAGPTYEGEVPNYGSYDKMLETKFRGNIKGTDIKTFAPEYKDEEEKKLLGDLDRIDQEYNIEFGEGGTDSGMSTQAIKQAGIGQTLKDTLGKVGGAIKKTASGLSSGLFGLLTQSQNKTSKSGFAGQGDFQADLAEKTMVTGAEEDFKTANAARESALTTASLDTKELENLKEKAAITMGDEKAGLISQIRGLQDEYNQAFQTSANNWIGKKFG